MFLGNDYCTVFRVQEEEAKAEASRTLKVAKRNATTHLNAKREQSVGV